MKTSIDCIDWETVLTTIYVLVDDGLKACFPEKASKRGRPKAFSDSEVLTLALAMDYLPFPGETQFLGFIRGNYRQWFPNLLDVSQFNRRLRQLSGRLEKLRQRWVQELGGTMEKDFLIDTKPIPVLGLKRDKRRSDFSGSATVGYCASRQMRYFGYKLALLSTWTGIPVAYGLVPAHTDEREAVEGILRAVRGCRIYGDKGFIGEFWQEQIFQQTQNRLLTRFRENQHSQLSPEEHRLLGRVRQRIEGVFHEIQNTGRNLERLLRKTQVGLCVHIEAKIASHTLRWLLRRRYGLDVLTFQTISPSF